MREWLVVAAIALGFGILASFASEEPGWFALANFGLAAASLVLGTIQVAFRARHANINILVSVITAESLKTGVRGTV